MLKGVFLFFRRLSVFRKILLSFTAIIVLPAILSLVISVKTSENLIISQAYSDALSSVDVVSISVSSVLSELHHASLYICNNGSTMELLTLLNETEKEMDGKGMSYWLTLQTDVEGLCNNVFYANRLNAYITLLSASGKVGYANYPVEDKQVQEYLQKYNSKYIKSLGIPLIFAGIEKAPVKKSLTGEKPSVVTWVKTVDSKKGIGMAGVLLVSVPVDEIVKLMVAESVPTKRVLLDGEKNVVASTEEEWLTKPFDSIYGVELLGKGYITARENDNVQSVLTYKEINKEGWMVVDIKPISELSGKLRDVAESLFLFNLGYIIIFLIVSAVIAHGITVSLRSLSKAMLKTDLNVNNKMVDKMSKDEVYMLEQNFDIMRININLLLQENIEKERKKREAELHALQSQISPHFLFNTLNSVRCAVETGKKEKASQIIIALIGLLKMTLTKGEPFIPLKQEIENLKNYVRILQMRHGIPFTAYYDIPEILADYKVPKLLLQPVVENSIIHGFEGITSEGLVSVSAELTANKVIISIHDNGKGMEQELIGSLEGKKELKFSGIGITNVDQRIKIHYGSAYGIEYKSVPNEGTTAEITLPGLC